MVTGGSRGIGYGVAARFAQRGARVLLTSRKAEAVAAAAHVADEEGGAVVNVSSNLALAPGGPSGVYGASKAALNYLTQQLAVELAPGVRVNAVAPGVVDTDMATVLVAQGDRLAGRWPLPRFGAPVDVADVVEFLAGPQSSWLTGQILVVDGGARLVGGTDVIEAAAP